MSNLKQGFLLPDPIDGYDLKEMCICIPDHPLYIAAFYAQLKALGGWGMWEKSGVPGDTRAARAAAYWRSIILPQLEDGFMCCCDQTSTLLQFQISNQFNAWVNVTNNTDINIDAPVTTFQSTTGETPEEDAARGDALCYAVRGLVDVMCEAALKQLEEQITRSTIAGIVGVIITAVLTFMGGPPGYIFGASIATAIAYGIGAIESLVNKSDLQDQIARQELACALYNALGGVAPTEANLWSTVDGLSGLGGVATHLQSLMTYLHVQPRYSREIFQAFVNALGEGKLLAQAGILPPCDCGCLFNHIWDWANNTPATLDGWSLLSTADIPAAAGYVFALADPGDGHLYVNASGNGEPGAGGVYTLTPEEQGCILHEVKVTCGVGAGYALGTVYLDTGSGFAAGIGFDANWDANYPQSKFSLPDMTGVQRVALVINSNITGHYLYVGKIELIFA